MKFAGILLSLLILVIPGQASAKCFTMKEAEAEQGLRIHSELMVIALNCQHLGKKNEKNLYVQYKEFTKKHEAVFAAYERALIKFYKSEGRDNPERELHELRTTFANKISKDAAIMRPDGFCKLYMPRIAKAGKMTDEKLRVWASTIFPAHPVSHPVCASKSH